MTVTRPGPNDPITRALRQLLVPEGEESGEGGSSSAIVETCATCLNAVVRTLRIPWCDGHLEWKVSSRGFSLWSRGEGLAQNRRRRRRRSLGSRATPLARSLAHFPAPLNN